MCVYVCVENVKNSVGCFIVVDVLGCICHRNLRYVDIHLDHVDCAYGDGASYVIPAANQIDFDDEF